MAAHQLNLGIDDALLGQVSEQLVSEEVGVMVPNGSLLADSLSNWTYSSTLRGVEVPVHVDATLPASRLMTELIEAVRDIPDILDDPAPQVLLDGTSQGLWTYRVRAWTDCASGVELIHTRLAARAAAVVERLRAAATC